MLKQQLNWATPVSLLPKEDQAQLVRDAFAQQFPHLVKPPVPDQRGFIIGSVRL